MDRSGEPPTKRRRLDERSVSEERAVYERDYPMQDVCHGTTMTFGGDDNLDAMRDEWNLDSHMRSSEEPGQGRRVSRPPSALGSQFEANAIHVESYRSGSQRTNLFPWDNAGVSSSVSGVAAVPARGGSDRLSFARADSRLRGSSVDKDSITAGLVPESPASFGIPASRRESTFEFDGRTAAVPCLLKSMIASQYPAVTPITMLMTRRCRMRV